MSPEKPLLVVCGATGNQGGSVINYFLSQPSNPYALRGITRDPSSAKSQALAAQGVEMVAGDFNHPLSLDSAFKGASAIFGVNDFWVYFRNAEKRGEAEAKGENWGALSRDNDTQEIKSIIDAASRVPALERFVLASMANSNKLSGGKYAECYHFEGKAIAEDYGRQNQPELWKKTSVLYVGFYLENYLGPMSAFFLPKLNKTKSCLVLNLGDLLPSVSWPWCAAIDDTGVLVAGLLRSLPGQRVIGNREWLTMLDITKILAELVDATDVEVSSEPVSFDMGDTLVTTDNMHMIGFSAEFGYDGHLAGNEVTEPSKLGISLPSVKEWFQQQDWASKIQTVE
ncbi:unnamed protein product [Clonostachys byssicola]|uniref:NmrA-like domain-containing protein n=1 Tax=Clonostachys byssicola TaxID=160290 RepID=A0A9N9UDS2_9HYPO|nr:unnamed protein product [Clonostachys byssicola]